MRCISVLMPRMSSASSLASVPDTNTSEYRDSSIGIQRYWRYQIFMVHEPNSYSMRKAQNAEKVDHIHCSQCCSGLLRGIGPAVDAFGIHRTVEGLPHLRSRSRPNRSLLVWIGVCIESWQARGQNYRQRRQALSRLPSVGLLQIPQGSTLEMNASIFNKHR